MRFEKKKKRVEFFYRSFFKPEWFEVFWNLLELGLRNFFIERGS